MIKEAADQFELYRAVHLSIEKMVAGLSDDEWMQRPAADMNNIASVIEHVVLVEEKFLSGIAGEAKDINTQKPFDEGVSDLSSIQSRWERAVSDTQAVLEQLTPDALDEPGMRLRVGDLNKRQLLSYMIAHTAHHRGQIPIIKKLNRQL